MNKRFVLSVLMSVVLLTMIAYQFLVINTFLTIFATVSISSRTLLLFDFLSFLHFSEIDQKDPYCSCYYCYHDYNAC